MRRKTAFPTLCVAAVLAIVLSSLTCAASSPQLDSSAASSDSFASLSSSAILALDTHRLPEAEALFAHIADVYAEKAADLALDRAWVYVDEAYDCLLAKDYASSDRLFSRAIDICPSIKPDVAQQWAFSRLEVCYFRLNSANADDKDFDWRALTQYAADTLALRAFPTESHYALGAVYDGGGDVGKAKSEYCLAIDSSSCADADIKSLRDAAYNAATAKERKCLRPVHPLLCQTDPGDFQILRDGPFVIRHHNLQLAKRAAAVLNYYWSRDVLDGFLPANQPFSCDCDVFIYRDQAEFLEAADEPQWALGCFRAKTDDGKATMLEMHVYQGTPHLLATTLPHELAHVRLAMVPGFHMGLPQWIQEGVAASSERDERTAACRRTLVEARAAGTLLPLTSIMNADAMPRDDSHSLAYAESLAAVEALIRRGGKDRFTEFVKVTGAKGHDEGLMKVYGLTQSALEDLMRTEIDSCYAAPSDGKAPNRPAAGSADIGSTGI